MTVILVLFACFFTAFMFINMISPFLKSQDDQLRFEVLDEDLKTLELLSEQKRFYTYQLQEIEGDFKANKLTEEDYKLFKRRFEREIILLMRKLEELHGGKGWEERVQQAYQKHIGTHQSSHSEQSHDWQEVADKAEPSPAHEAAPPARACHECQQPLEVDDRFCSQCGAKIDPVTMKTGDTGADAIEVRS